MGAKGDGLSMVATEKDHFEIVACAIESPFYPVLVEAFVTGFHAGICRGGGPLLRGFPKQQFHGSGRALGRWIKSHRGPCCRATGSVLHRPTKEEPWQTRLRLATSGYKGVVKPQTVAVNERVDKPSWLRKLSESEEQAVLMASLANEGLQREPGIRGSKGRFLMFGSPSRVPMG